MINDIFISFEKMVEDYTLDKAVNSVIKHVENCNEAELTVGAFFVGEDLEETTETAWATSHIYKRIARTLEHFEGTYSREEILSGINKIFESDSDQYFSTRPGKSFKFKVEG